MVIINIAEIIGTIAFALSGALIAIKNRFDYYGIIILAIITAFGGGIIRDVLIGVIPPVALREPIFIIISILSAIFCIRFYNILERFSSLFKLFDAVGLAAFATIGIEAGFSNQYSSVFLITIMAVLTGTGGGILRDIIVGEVPFVFKREVYSVAVIIGCLCFVFSNIVFGLEIALIICFFVTLFVRIIAYTKNLNIKTVEISAIDEDNKAKHP